MTAPRHMTDDDDDDDELARERERELERELQLEAINCLGTRSEASAVAAARRC